MDKVASNSDLADYGILLSPGDRSGILIPLMSVTSMCIK
jgi:hypothetical protein